MSRKPVALAIFVLIGLLAAPASAGPKKGRKAAPLKPPKGFIEMTVAGLREYRGSQAVVLKTKSEDYFLEIWIGASEAFAIELRLNRQRFQRPLTHDLLDTILRELGGKLVKIQVDDLKKGTFVGTVFVQHNKKMIPIDARPSDSIALAIGNHAPIFVSERVLKEAGIRVDKTKPAPGQETQDPEKLLKDILESEREEHTL